MSARPVHRYPTVGSTQDVALQLAQQGCADGTIVLADVQTAGRGRLDRRWESAPGDALLMSMVKRFRSPVVPSSLSARVALAVTDVVGDLAPAANVAIKWPNDVLLNGRKVSGILIQTRVGVESVAIVGVGLNLSAPRERLPFGATSIVLEGGQHTDRTDVAHAVADAIERSVVEAEAMTRVNDRLAFSGQQITLVTGDREVVGSVLGVAEDGSLQLECLDGRARFHSGEVTRGPRRTGGNDA